MKRGQVTVFVIIAVLIVGSVIAYFILRGGISGIEQPFTQESEAAQYFSGCIENTLKEGIAILEERGGYIYAPEFQAGNKYSPTSSHLAFLSLSVPYWYYVAASGIVKEQIPSLSGMEQQLERYLKEEMRCDLSSFTSKGEIADLQDIDYDVSTFEEVLNITGTNESVFNKSIFNEKVINETIINETIQNFSEGAVSTLQYKAVINRPVKWIKVVDVSRFEDGSIEIPKEAGNITIKTDGEIQQALSEM